ncbi:MAG: M16 family metallopeptidase [Haliscomenobacter sp.]
MTKASIPNPNTLHDPLQVHSYTLSNGLQLFLSVNKKEPRIYTHIVVRAGSKQDPADTTGLAHYMEHMLFKGTSRIGALDWEKEKPMLDQIAQLYELHRQTKDEAERQQIYAAIDRLSFEAAKLVAPSEYDKLASTIGAKNVNAYTWVEQTVYVNDIPSNEVERWMLLEAERFRMMALRLFHTELETVYEEFNINQDRDFRKVSYALNEALFPNHPYGTQTTMGTAEHLRNPSMINIQRFFETYYVPGNMALIMSGDLDIAETIRLAETYFGKMEARPVPPFTFEPQPPIEQPIRIDVTGKEAPYLLLGWRMGNSQSDAPLMATLIQHLLYNQQAGLLDLQINQRQLVLESEAWMTAHEDYSVFGLYAKPREGQTLQEIEQLLLRTLKELREGNFPAWLPEAVIKDFKLGETKSLESNEARVQLMASAYILGIDWSRMANRFAWMESVTKEQIVHFVRTHLRDDNYVAIYKHQGDDLSQIKVEKPPITAVELQREAISEFAQAFYNHSVPSLEPVFADFDSAISVHRISDSLSLDYVHNPLNELFRMDYIFEFGKNSDRHLALALKYLPYLGAGKYTPEELQIQFFRLGLSFEVNYQDERAFISLSGLEESFEKGLELLEYLLEHIHPDEDALQNLISDILMQREHAKSDRSSILRHAMSSYAKYGPDSSFTYRLSAQELQAVHPEKLVGHIRSLTRYPHQIYYYGQQPAAEVVRLLQRYHQPAYPPLPLPENRSFPELETAHNQVLFVHFPIVQADVLMLSKGTPHFHLEEHLMRDLYNDYFGYGLSSVVFQEIRESKALAYSTYAYYGSPRQQHLAHYLQAYVGTQPDKLPDAIPALLQILQHMPIDTQQIEQARLAILKKIESERLTPSEIYYHYRSTQDLGFSHNLQKDLYHRMKQISPADLIQFQQRYVQNRNYTFLVLGDREAVDLSYLQSFGPVTERSLEEIFGY